MLDGPHARLRPEAEGQDGHVEPLHHRRAGGIVGVHDGGANGLGRLGQELEQAALGEPIALERAVKVEVILREVREHRHVERETVGAGERKRVRRDFHGDAAHAAVAHLREHGL